MKELKQKITDYARLDMKDVLDRIEAEYKDYGMEDKPDCIKEDEIIDIIMEEIKHGLRMNIKQFIEKLDQI